MLETAWESRWLPDPFKRLTRMSVLYRTDMFQWVERKADVYKRQNEDSLSGEDIREGLTAIVSVKVEEPQFEGQTKQKLGNSEARGAVDNIVSEQLTYYLEQNPTCLLYTSRCV